MAEESEQSTEQGSKTKFKPAVLGWVVILLILAAYFMWMTIEMGTAAVSGSAPMFAFLFAAAIGVGAAGAALAIGRKR